VPGDSLKLPTVPTDTPNFTLLFAWNPVFPERLTVLINHKVEDAVAVDGLDDEDTAEPDDGGVPKSGLGDDEAATPEYSTYRIRLDNPVDQSWFQRLPNWRRIVSFAKMYGQVAYWPATGVVEDAGDAKDEEDAHRVRGIFADARREQTEQQWRERRRNRKVPARRDNQSKPPRLSPEVL